MFIRGESFFLALSGFASGGVIAAGVFAFLAVIGVFPRLIGKTGTRKHVMLYETAIIVGGIWANIVSLYSPPFFLPGWMGLLFLLTAGLAAGIFVGCLVMSLAETLNALPVFTRRIHLAVGFPYVISAVALGKLAGSLIYFLQGVGSA